MIVVMHLKSIVSVAFVVCASSHFVNGHIQTPRQITDKCDLSARPQCSSDCTQILACVSRVRTPVLSVNCTGDTPYCDNGRCVAAPGKCTKKAQEAAFLCTSAGVFPDPRDCRKSHFCADVGSQSKISVCPRGHIFDSKIKVCGLKPANSESICQKVSCNDITNDFVSFTANPTFYAYCFTSATDVHHTYMYKCDDEINKIFDLTIKKCRFNCKSIGYHADPLDCSSYYICNGLKFASRRVHCPPNYYFNGTVCLNSKAHCPIGSLVTSSTAKPSTSTATNSIADDMFTTLQPTSISETSLSDEATATQTPIAESSSADEMTTTYYDLTPTVEITTDTTAMPFVEFSTTHKEATVEITTDTTAMPFSTTERSTTHIPFSTTERSTTHKPETVASAGLQMDLTTKRPSIWKHMGLISVRVGRLLNIV